MRGRLHGHAEPEASGPPPTEPPPKPGDWPRVFAVDQPPASRSFTCGLCASAFTGISADVSLTVFSVQHYEVCPARPSEPGGTTFDVWAQPVAEEREARWKCRGCGSVSDGWRSTMDEPLPPSS